MCTTISNVYAKETNAENIYNFAKNNDLKSLQENSKYLDIEDSNGDTAYCMALRQNEKDVAKILEKAGANTNHKCVSTIPSENKTFLGMGKKGWLTTGAVVVAGGVAAAAGGGGGGGGSGSSGNYEIIGKYNAITNNDTITLKNTSSKDVYGMKNVSQSQMMNASKESGNGSVIGNINIENENGSYNRIYGMYSDEGEIFNAYGKSLNNENINVIGNIRIENYSDSSSYGLYTDRGTAVNGFSDGNTENIHVEGRISIINHGNGLSRGIYAKNVVNNPNDTVSILNLGRGSATGLYGHNNVFNAGNVEIHNIGSGYATGISGNNIENYGMIVIAPSSYTDDKLTTSTSDDVTYQGKNLSNSYATGIGYSAYNNYDGKIINAGGIGIAYSNYAHGIDAYMSSDSGVEVAIYNDSIILLTDNDSSYGISADNNYKIYNNGDITIKNSKYSYGIEASGKGYIINSGTIQIDNAQSATGISASAYDDEELIVINEGTIKITNSEFGYGIKASGKNTIVSNTGVISINNKTCYGANCENNSKAILLYNGASFVNMGTLSAQTLSLNDFGGEVVATSTSSFVAKDDISGNLSISNNVVRNGFDTTYTIKDMINAADTSNLNLVSKSAMFNADLKNGKDAVMTMKSFNDVLENKSLANFLQKNYALQNNEGLFGSIKSAESIKSLNNFADEMFGKDMFSRFAFEDLMIMRELNFDINNKLFNNKEDYLSIGGNKSSFAFSGNSRYSLTSNTVGDYSVGLSVAFSDINSDDGNDNNQRYDRMYNISMPVGYQANGLKFVSAPRVGYSYGTYDRNGFDNQTYEGTVEKQMFAFMNEARYPIQVGGWSISPSAELNFINYRISGHEKDKKYSLKIKSQNNYSVEAGVGLYASKETNFSKDSSLRFNGGVALYHEFADPYKMKLGMTGMAGTFTLRDEDRSDNRAVIQSEIEFKHKNFSIVGNVASYIDRKYETNATLDFNFEF